MPGPGVSLGIGSAGLALSGTIADDGTFQATSGTIGGGSLPAFSVSVTGNSPLTTAPSVWTGTYSIVVTEGSVQTSCNMVQTANFSASAIAPVTGTYIGVPTITPFGAGATVSVQISQGAPALIPHGSAMVYSIPLAANLSIAHSACALSTATTGLPEPSTIGGDRFDIFFPSAGIPSEVLAGTLNDATSNTFVGDLTPLAVDRLQRHCALYLYEAVGGRGLMPGGLKEEAGSSPWPVRFATLSHAPDRLFARFGLLCWSCSGSIVYACAGAEESFASGARDGASAGDAAGSAYGGVAVSCGGPGAWGVHDA